MKSDGWLVRCDGRFLWLPGLKCVTAPGKRRTAVSTSLASLNARSHLVIESSAMSTISSSENGSSAVEP